METRSTDVHDKLSRASSDTMYPTGRLAFVGAVAMRFRCGWSECWDSEPTTETAVETPAVTPAWSWVCWWNRRCATPGQANARPRMSARQTGGPEDRRTLTMSKV